MPITPTVLFDQPHSVISSTIMARIAASVSTRIVVGFATPGGLAAIDAPIRANPGRLTTLVLGAATYPAFQVIDDLIAAGVPQANMRVHLGHTMPTGGRRHPHARFHPMFHSKIYYMELPGAQACAVIGSHNLTSFALGGLNGEASVMLEGPASASEFQKVRQHIDATESEAAPYSPDMKEAYAWWSKEFFDGLGSEVSLPSDWRTVRTILIFAAADGGHRPKPGDVIYFELPSGIQIESLTTEVHLFLFHTLPSTPWEALARVSSAVAKFTSRTLGADNEQGNAEVRANWQLDQTLQSILRPVPTGRYRPTTRPDMQQVRAKVEGLGVVPWEYAFERERGGWEPVFSPKHRLRLHQEMPSEFPSDDAPHADSNAARRRDLLSKMPLSVGRGGERSSEEWKLVTGLSPRTGSAVEVDQLPLALARPESGSFVLVSLRRRAADRLIAGVE